jgi:phage terminase Nu1 subunit (DNA packaging protein)
MASDDDSHARRKQAVSAPVFLHDFRALPRRAGDHHEKDPAPTFSDEAPAVSRIVNKAKLAEVHGVSEETLTRWQAEGMPVLDHGARGQSSRYDTGATIRWRIERAIARAGAGDSVRARRDQVAMDREELALEKAKAQLVPADQVEPIWEARVLATAAFLISRHSRLAAKLEAAPDIEAKRQLLKQADAAFLKITGLHGDAIQETFEHALSRLPPDEVHQIIAAASNSHAPQPRREP